MSQTLAEGHPPQPHGRKRKQQSPPTQTLEQPPSSAAARQQSTITDHFSPRGESPAVVTPKRSKQDLFGPASFKEEQKTPVTQATMLNFGSAAEPIDLTDSPTPKERSRVSTPVNNKPSKPPSFQTHTGTRKIQVKNLRKSTKNNAETYFNTTWTALDAALTSIFKKEKISASLEELYRGVENICRSDKAPDLFEKLRERCSRYVEEELKKDIMKNLSSDDIEAARLVESSWAQWKKQLSTIRSIFLYLDRSYLFASPQLQSIEAIGLAQFQKHVATDEKLEPRLLDGIFALFEQDRDNRGQESVNLPLLMSGVTMISNLGLYSSSFEPLFLEISRDYYKRLSARDRAQYNLAQYAKECASQIEGEGRRCDQFKLEHSTKRKLIAVVEDEMLRAQIPLLTKQEAVQDLFERVDTESLETLFRLLDRVGNAGELLKPALSDYIITKGTTIVADKEHQSEMVPRLLDFKGLLDYMWTRPLQRNDTIGYALRESFQKFINARRPEDADANNSKPAEMIAKYVDVLLRSGTKGLPPVAGRETEESALNDDEAALAYRLELVLDLFRFIGGKDVFEAFYKKDLARRLLLGRSASVDAERLMLTKLKTECGSGFTHNLEYMFKDMDLSKESVASFKTTKSGLSAGVDLSVNILSSAAWPTYPEIPVNIPHHLATYLESFEKFYVSKHSGRKLSWRHYLAHCIVRADLPKGRKELMLSAFQAVILLAFNDIPLTSVLTFADLLSSSGLPAEELKLTLQSLACGRTRILLKSPKGKEVSEEDKFQLNAGFSDPKFRVKINQIQHKETKKENKDTHEAVARDRKYETQAAIIRIMKGRKRVRHVELVQATIEQTKNRGMLDVTDIKANIERLIEKDYMDREEGDYYVYVA